MRTTLVTIVLPPLDVSSGFLFRGPSPAALRVLHGHPPRPAKAEPPPATRSTAPRPEPSESRTSLELPLTQSRRGDIRDQIRIARSATNQWCSAQRGRSKPVSGLRPQGAS